MEKINHAIVTRARFADKELRDKYYKISKEILIPSLKGQLEQNFVWVLFMLEEDVDYTKEYFGIDFVPIFDIPGIEKYTKENKINIQTRHDIDDWASPQYVKEIQKIYRENIEKYDRFVIHAQPTKYMYHEKKEKIMVQYTDTRNSMFVSLCQKEVRNHILEKKRKHQNMWELASKVFKIKEGCVKWVIHGDNISCIGR